MPPDAIWLHAVSVGETRAAAPLVAALPRAPGTKETRHVHLLGGDALVQEMAEAQGGGASAGGGRGRIAELEDEVRRLREELDALRSEFATFRQQFD